MFKEENMGSLFTFLSFPLFLIIGFVVFCFHSPKTTTVKKTKEKESKIAQTMANERNKECQNFTKMSLYDLNMMTLHSSLTQYLKSLYGENLKCWEPIQPDRLLLDEVFFITITLQNGEVKKQTVLKLPKNGFHFSLLNIEQKPPKENQEEKKATDTTFSISEWLTKNLPILQKEREKAIEEQTDCFPLPLILPKEHEEEIKEKLELKSFFLVENETGTMVYI